LAVLAVTLTNLIAACSGVQSISGPTGEPIPTASVRATSVPTGESSPTSGVRVTSEPSGEPSSTTDVPSTSPVPTARASVDAQPSTALPGWTLVWSDEFNDPAGTLPDPAHWGYALGDGSSSGNPGWGNHELEYYTQDPANASTDGQGNLLITARPADGSIGCYYGTCRYTSARLLTKDRFEFTYGHVEARIKVPSGAGAWPAFWMLGSNIDTLAWPRCGEVDVMEQVGRLPNRVYGTIHGPGYSGNRAVSATIDLPQPVADEFHVFAIDWTRNNLTWTVDGKPYLHASSGDVAPNRWAFNLPFFLLLNLAVGGDFGGPVGADAQFPQSMSVDYIRVYRAAGS
jgi:beta-glucanase (GH16 family)